MSGNEHDYSICFFIGLFFSKLYYFSGGSNYYLHFVSDNKMYIDKDLWQIMSYTVVVGIGRVDEGYIMLTLRPLTKN